MNSIIPVRADDDLDDDLDEEDEEFEDEDGDEDEDDEEDGDEEDGETWQVSRALISAKLPLSLDFRR